jgi:hypothetical protein
MLWFPHCLDNRLTVNCEILATCSSTYSPVRTSQEAHSISKSKAIPVTGHGSLWGREMLRFPRFLDQWYSTFFVLVPQDVISLQLCTPKLLVYYSSYVVFNLQLE